MFSTHFSFICFPSSLKSPQPNTMLVQNTLISHLSLSSSLRLLQFTFMAPPLILSLSALASHPIHLHHCSCLFVYSFISPIHLHCSNSTDPPPQDWSRKKQVRGFDNWLDQWFCGFQWWDRWDKGCVLCNDRVRWLGVMSWGFKGLGSVGFCGL